MTDPPATTGRKSPFSLAEVMTIYGLSLMIGGAMAYQASGLERKALSAIFVGNGSAVICFMLAAGMRNPNVQKGESMYVPFMISVHLAFIFPVLLAAVLGWRLSVAWPNPDKAYLLPYLGFMIVTSLATALSIYRRKPKKNKKGAVAADKNAKKTDGDGVQQQDDGESKTDPSPSVDAPASTVRRRARRAAVE